MGDMLDEVGVRRAVRKSRGSFYLYVLCRPNGEPFYVGKGKGLRVLDHEREARGVGNSHKLNVIRSIVRRGQAIGYRIVAFHAAETDCHANEKSEILRLGRRDLGTGPLTNLTDGGEGISGISEQTRRRIDFELHSDDAPGGRGLANRFFHVLAAAVKSVPIRPLSSMMPRPSRPHVKARRPTLRCAAALAASAKANGILLVPGCVIPRRMEIDDAQLLIENGASSDLLAAGMATLIAARSPLDERFELSESQVSLLLSFVDGELIGDAGLMPA